VLFIDEIHRLAPVVEEILYPRSRTTDRHHDRRGPGRALVKLDLPPFTLVGATTRAGMLTNPLRDRFGIVARLSSTPTPSCRRSSTVRGLLKVEVAAEGAFEIAKRSRAPRACRTAPSPRARFRAGARSRANHARGRGRRAENARRGRARPDVMDRSYSSR